MNSSKQKTLITGYIGQGGAVDIPSTIKGLPVTSIGAQAFYSRISVTSVTIPNSVVSIGESAFYGCVSLTNVTILDGVSSIGSVSFSSCFRLANVTIPDSVQSIGTAAFLSCVNLTNVTIGVGVTNIAGRAFESCSNLMTITVNALNSDYSSVDGVLFNKSRTMLVQYPVGKAGSSYTIPDSVTRIGSEAFSSCTSLTLVTIPNRVTSIGNSAFSDCSGLTSAMIPDSLTSIGDYAFEGCNHLTDITIPNSVHSVGNYAFQSCTGVTNITIGNGVTKIGLLAFGNCASLKAITVDLLNSSFSSIDGILLNKSLTRLIQYPAAKAGDYTIPSSVTLIVDSAFSSCIGLTGVTITNSFVGLGGGVFSYCSSLTNVTIGEGVTDIPSWTFNLCGSLTSVTIGKGVTVIGEWAFGYCTSLVGVYFQGDAPYASPTAFNNADNGTVYYLPGTTGWGRMYAGLPTAPWSLPYPLILNFGTSFGLQTNRFGFIISWATNLPVVVEGSTTLYTPSWSPVGTNAFKSGSSYFNDPKWTNSKARFYRLRSP